MFVTIRSLSNGLQHSEFSQPLYIPAKDIELLKDVERSLGTESSAHSTSDAESCISAVKGGSNIPMIEITNDAAFESWGLFSKFQNDQKNHTQKPDSREFIRRQQHDHTKTSPNRLLTRHVFEEDFSSDDASTGTSESRKRSAQRSCSCASSSSAPNGQHNANYAVRRPGKKLI